MFHATLIIATGGGENGLPNRRYGYYHYCEASHSEYRSRKRLAACMPWNSERR